MNLPSYGLSSHRSILLTPHLAQFLPSTFRRSHLIVNHSPTSFRIPPLLQIISSSLQIHLRRLIHKTTVIRIFLRPSFRDLCLLSSQYDSIMGTNYSVVPSSKFVRLRDDQPPIARSKKASVLQLASVNGDGKSNPHKSIALYGEREPIFSDFEDDFDDLDIDNYPHVVAGSGHGSASGVPGAVFNLTTSIIGAGIMALPATMKVLGLGLGFTLIIVMGIVSEISVEMLIRFAVYCKANSYGEVVQYALGRPARILSEICIIVNNGGVLVVYLIIIGDVLSGSLRHVGVFDQLLGGSGVWDHRRLVIFVVLLVFLAPLCALKKIDSLSLTSAASVALAVIFVIVACAIAFVKLVEGKIEAPRLTPDFSSKKAVLDLLVVIPIMTNAYVCHFNVQPIYNELEGRSPQKMNHVGRITTVLCVVVYSLTAISGYLLFGKDTESDVLTNFDTDLGVPFSRALDYIVRIGYILHLVTVFPVIHFSLRQTVNALVFEKSAPLAESKNRFIGLTVVLLALIYIGSTMIPSIWTAFKFTGATTAVSLGFIFPSLIALRLSREGEPLTRGEKILSWTMLVLAVIVSVIGVTGNLYGLRSKSD